MSFTQVQPIKIPYGGCWSTLADLVRADRKVTNLWVGNMLINATPGVVTVMVADRESFQIIRHMRSGEFSRIEISATNKETATKVLLFREQIIQAVLQKPDVRRGEYLNEFRICRDRWMAETKKFGEWKSAQPKDDALIDILVKKYGDELHERIDVDQERLIEALCNLAKELGARYISLHPDYLVCFENVAVATTNGLMPVACIIAELLEVGLGANTYNSGIRVYMRPYLGLGDIEDGGIYDLTADKPVKIGPAITEDHANHPAIDRRRNPREPVDMWLQRCQGQLLDRPWEL